MLHVVNGVDLTVTEETSVHSTPITCLKWNAAGTRLVSADRAGWVGVWRMDHRAKLVPMSSYHKAGSITHVAFTVNEPKADDKRCVSLRAVFASMPGSAHHTSAHAYQFYVSLRHAAAVCAVCAL
jgi:hypothetical protein